MFFFVDFFFVQLHSNRRYNRYGFFVDEKAKRLSEDERRAKVRHENERNEKWTVMFKNWNEWVATGKVTFYFNEFRLCVP